MLAKFSHAMQQCCAWVGMAAVALLMLHVVVDVGLRYLLNITLPGTLEFVTYWWMILIGFAGLIVAQVSRDHIRATIVVDRLSSRASRQLNLAGMLLSIVFLVVLAAYGLDEALKQMRVGEYGGAAETPIWPMRFWVPLGSGVFIVRLLSEFLDSDKVKPKRATATDDGKSTGTGVQI